MGTEVVIHPAMEFCAGVRALNNVLLNNVNHHVQVPCCLDTSYSPFCQRHKQHIFETDILLVVIIWVVTYVVC